MILTINNNFDINSASHILVIMIALEKINTQYKSVNRLSISLVSSFFLILTIVIMTIKSIIKIKIKLKNSKR